ncbi:MAG: hypothetical protein COS85_01865 [Armatimonadetes bacterium CG07_land_8_20_14_0_80_59_28]|nr:MAG: hypothetical protein COS85_01865 [Armatimonadetes bacterium CG07_land_8_20_14_0_80_59_28]
MQYLSHDSFSIRFPNRAPKAGKWKDFFPFDAERGLVERHFDSPQVHLGIFEDQPALAGWVNSDQPALLYLQ